MSRWGFSCLMLSLPLYCELWEWKGAHLSCSWQYPWPVPGHSVGLQQLLVENVPVNTTRRQEGRRGRQEAALAEMRIEPLVEARMWGLEYFPLGLLLLAFHRGPWGPSWWETVQKAPWDTLTNKRLYYLALGWESVFSRVFSWPEETFCLMVNRRIIVNDQSSFALTGSIFHSFISTCCLPWVGKNYKRHM